MDNNGAVAVEAPNVEETLTLFSGRKLTRKELDALLAEVQQKLEDNPITKRCKIKAFGSAWGVIIYRSCTRAEYKRMLAEVEARGKGAGIELIAGACTILPGGEGFVELAEALPGLPAILSDEILTLSGIDKVDSLKG